MLYILYYRIFCYPPGQPKLSVATTDGLVFDTGTLKIHVKFYMNTNKFCMNMHEFAWKHMNFT